MSRVEHGHILLPPPLLLLLQSKLLRRNRARTLPALLYHWPIELMHLSAHCNSAEQAAQKKESKNFANQTWLASLKASTDDVMEREILHMLRSAELHNTQYVLGEVRQPGCVCYLLV
jgi:hypothetical protein